MRTLVLVLLVLLFTTVVRAKSTWYHGGRNADKKKWVSSDLSWTGASLHLSEKRVVHKNRILQDVTSDLSWFDAAIKLSIKLVIPKQRVLQDVLSDVPGFDKL
jgi:hypothetical protein